MHLLKMARFSRVVSVDGGKGRVVGQVVHHREAVRLRFIPKFLPQDRDLRRDGWVTSTEVRAVLDDSLAKTLLG